MNGKQVSVGDYCWNHQDVMQEVYKITDILLANNGSDDTLSVIVCRSIDFWHTQDILEERWGHKTLALTLEDFQKNYLHKTKLPSRFTKNTIYADLNT
jgi:hypothetical protein